MAGRFSKFITPAVYQPRAIQDLLFTPLMRQQQHNAAQQAAGEMVFDFSAYQGVDAQRKKELLDSFNARKDKILSDLNSKGVSPQTARDLTSLVSDYNNNQEIKAISQRFKDINEQEKQQRQLLAQQKMPAELTEKLMNYNRRKFANQGTAFNQETGDFNPVQFESAPAYVDPGSMIRELGKYVSPDAFVAGIDKLILDADNSDIRGQLEGIKGELIANKVNLSSAEGLTYLAKVKQLSGDKIYNSIMGQMMNDQAFSKSMDFEVKMNLPPQIQDLQESNPQMYQQYFNQAKQQYMDRVKQAIDVHATGKASIATDITPIKYRHATQGSGGGGYGKIDLPDNVRDVRYNPQKEQTLKIKQAQDQAEAKKIIENGTNLSDINNRQNLTEALNQTEDAAKSAIATNATGIVPADMLYITGSSADISAQAEAIRNDPKNNTVKKKAVADKSATLLEDVALAKSKEEALIAELNAVDNDLARTAQLTSNGYIEIDANTTGFLTSMLSEASVKKATGESTGEYIKSIISSILSPSPGSAGKALVKAAGNEAKAKEMARKIQDLEMSDAELDRLASVTEDIFSAPEFAQSAATDFDRYSINLLLNENPQVRASALNYLESRYGKGAWESYEERKQEHFDEFTPGRVNVTVQGSEMNDRVIAANDHRKKYFEKMRTAIDKQSDEMTSYASDVQKNTEVAKHLVNSSKSTFNKDSQSLEGLGNEDYSEIEAAKIGDFRGSTSTSAGPVIIESRTDGTQIYHNISKQLRRGLIDAQRVEAGDVSGSAKAYAAAYDYMFERAQYISAINKAAELQDWETVKKLSAAKNHNDDLFVYKQSIAMKDMVTSSMRAVQNLYSDPAKVEEFFGAAQFWRGTKGIPMDDKARQETAITYLDDSPLLNQYVQSAIGKDGEINNAVIETKGDPISHQVTVTLYPDRNNKGESLSVTTNSFYSGMMQLTKMAASKLSKQDGRAE